MRTSRPRPLSARRLAHLRSEDGQPTQERIRTVLAALPHLPTDYPCQLTTYIDDLATLRRLGCITGRPTKFSRRQITGLTLDRALAASTVGDSAAHH